jgi:hypothetical protein
MEAMPEQWTEGRLDELSRKVDKGFERVDKRFEGIEADIRSLRGEMKAMERDLSGRLDSIQRTMIQMMVALTAAIVSGFAGIFALLAVLL